MPREGGKLKKLIILYSVFFVWLFSADKMRIAVMDFNGGAGVDNSLLLTFTRGLTCTTLFLAGSFSAC